MNNGIITEHQSWLNTNQLLQENQFKLGLNVKGYLIEFGEYLTEVHQFSSGPDEWAIIGKVILQTQITFMSAGATEKTKCGGWSTCAVLDVGDQYSKTHEPMYTTKAPPTVVQCVCV